MRTASRKLRIWFDFRCVLFCLVSIFSISIWLTSLVLELSYDCAIAGEPLSDWGPDNLRRLRLYEYRFSVHNFGRLCRLRKKLRKKEISWDFSSIVCYPCAHHPHQHNLLLKSNKNILFISFSLNCQLLTLLNSFIAHDIFEDLDALLFSRRSQGKMWHCDWIPSLNPLAVIPVYDVGVTYQMSAPKTHGELMQDDGYPIAYIEKLHQVAERRLDSFARRSRLTL